MNILSHRSITFYDYMIPIFCHFGRIKPAGFSHVGFFMYAKFSCLIIPPHTRYAIIFINMQTSSDCFHCFPWFGLRQIYQNSKKFLILRYGFHLPIMETRHNWDHLLSKRNRAHYYENTRSKNPLPNLSEKIMGHNFQAFLKHTFFSANRILRAMHTPNRSGHNHISYMA